MNEPLLLYSINSWLAYKISERYFHNIHYVWCAPFFDDSERNPPSSNPREIYNTWLRDIKGKDAHSAKINQNRAGLIHAATIKLSEKVINERQHDEIIAIVNQAEICDFKPLIYVIPYVCVRSFAQPVSHTQKASIFSEEYIIEKLERASFDVLCIE